MHSKKIQQPKRPFHTIPKKEKENISITGHWGKNID